VFSFRDWSAKKDDKDLERLERRRASRRRYRETHKEQIKAAARRYRETHKDEISEHARRYHESHKEEIRKARRRYRETHKEEIKAAQRRYRETHKEQISERARHKWQTDPDHREKHRVRNRLAQRRMVFRKVYGISWADYEAMFERQGGACAICKRTGLTLCVDHCHLTGEVRGLLCIRCNSAIGFCSDDPALLLAAAAYLRAARDCQKAKNSGCAVAGACSGEVVGGSPKRTCATPESVAGVPIPQEPDTR
jgi:Recombination endonuclease VII